jgi:DNA modification methylase
MKVPAEIGNRIFFHSAEAMPELPSESVQLAISFPPFLQKPGATYLNKGLLISMLRQVHSELFRVLAPNGFLVSVNTDVRDHRQYNNGRIPAGRIWWKHQSIRQLCEEAGFRCLDTKIWVKTLKRDLYRFTYAYIVFFGKRDHPLGCRKKDDCPEFKLDVWLLEGQTRLPLSDGRIFRDCLHPLLVERCVRQLSARGDTILAPFAGVGTIPIVARRLQRRWNGYEIDESLRATLVDRLGPRAVQYRGPRNPTVTPARQENRFDASRLAQFPTR